ncbi:unnamed protein product [Ilex paraguariensis]|uniref:Uncharacterized protein n=1 Tax=Ilex paraguariensis TaxID=185542 RepID=A0ABC8RV00_9AQUA
MFPVQPNGVGKSLEFKFPCHSFILHGRGIETNRYAQLKCDSLKIGMVKHPEVAQFLGGRLYDCVFKYNEM